MRNCPEKQKEIEVNSIENLARLFRRRLNQGQDIKMLKHFLGDVDQHNSLKKSEFNKFIKNKVKKNRTTSHCSKPIIVRQSLVLPSTTKNNGFLKKQPSSRKKSEESSTKRLQLLKSLRKSITNITNLSPTKSPTTKQGKLYTSYSKKGRLLAPNMHSIITEDNIFLVCEGKGEGGEEVSRFISRFLFRATRYLFSLEQNRRIFQQNDYIVRLNQSFKQIFSSANYELICSGIESQWYMYTVTITVLLKDKLVVCSLGGSNTLLIGKSQIRNLRHQNQSILVQKSKNSSMLKTHRKSKTFRKNMSEEKENDFQVFERVKSDNQSPSPVPQTRIVNIQENDYLIVGSRSLFNQVSSQEMAKLTHQYCDKKLDNVAKGLVDLACKRMNTIRHEDISCILVKLYK